MALFPEILENTRPPSGALALFWLDQSHFILKTSGGALIHFDPYLSRAVKPEFHFHPKPLLAPEKTRADFVFLTHDHRDHTDRHTITPLAKANPDCLFAATPEAAERCRRECEVPEKNIETMREGDCKEFSLPAKNEIPPRFSVRAVFAQDTSDPPDTTHLGYVLEFNDIRIYHVGDTRKNPDAYLDRFAAVANLSPDVMLVPINAGYDNPGPAGAARLMEIVQPRITVPCHYGCFTHNTMDPARFVAAAPPAWAERIRILPRGGSLLVERRKPIP